jgi:hypothetical protein
MRKGRTGPWSIAIPTIYRSRLTNLYEALDGEETRTEAAEVIRSLVDEIVLTPEAPGWRAHD